jgi:hypothetical protein
MRAQRTPSPEQVRRRRRLSRAWALIVLAWAVGRTLVVWAALRDYGIEPWWYLLIDLVCAAIDGVTTPRTVIAIVDARYRRAAAWGAASAVTFVVPDVYIFLSTDHLPRMIVVVVVAVVAVTSTVTVVGVVRKVRAIRRLRTEESGPEPEK